MPETGLHDTDYLHHIADELEFLLRMHRGLQSPEELREDEIKQRAIVRSLEIIGEAANKLSAEFKETYPEIPWRKLTDTRNRLIHGYFTVSLSIVWFILENEAEPLYQAILPLIK